jgi:hypothetical protein
LWLLTSSGESGEGNMEVDDVDNAVVIATITSSHLIIHPFLLHRLTPAYISSRPVNR